MLHKSNDNAMAKEQIHLFIFTNREFWESGLLLNVSVIYISTIWEFSNAPRIKKFQKTISLPDKLIINNKVGYSFLLF